MFAHQWEHVTPDAMIVGKALGGGFYPVSAVVARREVLGVFHPGDHGSTFGGNPICAAAAGAVLETIDADGLLTAAGERGAQLRDGILAAGHPLVDHVRGRGLLLGVVLSAPSAKEAEAAARDAAPPPERSLDGRTRSRPAPRSACTT